MHCTGEHCGFVESAWSWRCSSAECRSKWDHWVQAPFT